MTPQEQHPTHARVDDAILRDIGSLRKELIGVKRLVLTQLDDLKQKLTTLTDVLLPQPSQETTPTSTGDTMMKPTTREDSPSARVPAGASRLEESAHHDHAVHHQPVSPADQEPSDDPAEGAQQR
jgi:hypothetical protein